MDEPKIFYDIQYHKRIIIKLKTTNTEEGKKVKHDHS